LGVVFFFYNQRFLLVYDIEKKFVPFHNSDEISDISSIDAKTYRCAFDDSRNICHSRSFAGLTGRDDDVVFVSFYLDKVVDVSGENSDFSDGFFTEILVHQDLGIEILRHDFLSIVFREIALDKQRSRQYLRMLDVCLESYEIL